MIQILELAGKELKIFQHAKAIRGKDGQNR